jgi:hypothetical protein
VFSFTGFLLEAMQAALFVDDWWEHEVSPLFMILPINIHDVWSAISEYFLQVWPYETLIRI